MNRDELCYIGTVFVEDDNYLLSRYEDTDQDMYFKAWIETFENSPVINDEQFKKRSWEDVLSDTNKLQLKVIEKRRESMLVKLYL